MKKIMLAAIAVTLATSSVAFAADQLEMPLTVVLTPKMSGYCTFRAGQGSRPCGNSGRVTYMEFKEAKRSNFSVSMTNKTVISFSGRLASQQGLVGTVAIDRILLDGDYEPVWASGNCTIEFKAPGTMDVADLTCQAQTAVGALRLDMGDASGEVILGR